MRIVVVGAGTLGYEIAQRLVEQNCDVVVVDVDPDALAPVEQNLDVLVVEGNGATPKVLAAAGAHRSDLLISVAGADEVNLIACSTAKRIGVPLCGARVRNAEYLGDAHAPHAHSAYGIDVVIHPERSAAVEIARLVKTPHATQVDYFANGRISVIGLKVEPGAPVAAGPLKKVRPRRCIVAAVVRGEHMFIPDGNTVIRPDDRLYVVIPTGHFGALRELTGSKGRSPRRLTVVGGGRIGEPLVHLLARGLRRGMEITVIEKDRARSRALAASVPDGVVVLEGDGAKFDVLEGTPAEGGDEFIAVTGDDATNLLAVMAAKQLGVGQAITALSREDYETLAQRAGADAIVVPRLIAVGTLLHLMHKSPVLSLALLEQGRAEAVEIVAEVGAPAVGKQLQQLEGLKGVILGALLRRDDVLLPDGSTRVEPGDRVVLFGMAPALPRARALFRA